MKPRCFHVWNLDYRFIRVVGPTDPFGWPTWVTKLMTVKTHCLKCGKKHPEAKPT